jgi:predicted nucleic acid-binding protein
MRYVLDSSVAVKWAVAEVDADKALRLRDDARAGVHELLAPDIFPVEVGHALTRGERQGRIPTGDAEPLWQLVMADAPQLHPFLPLMLRALQLSSRMRVGVYDCLYVALAEREVCAFVTADVRLIANLQPHFAFIVPLASLP